MTRKRQSVNCFQQQIVVSISNVSVFKKRKKEKEEKYKILRIIITNVQFKIVNGTKLFSFLFKSLLIEIITILFKPTHRNPASKRSHRAPKREKGKKEKKKRKAIRREGRKRN